MISTHIFSILVFLLRSFSISNAFQLKNCTSDRTQEVSWDGAKATIRYDNSKEISFSGSSNVTIWCEANGAIDSCILEQHTLENNKFELKCNYAYPQSHTPEIEYSCHENERIEYKSVHNDACIFVIKRLKSAGI